MKAVVLVGGEGTRMRPLTETIPKPLIPFMNRPFLDHVLDHLAAHGMEDVICSSPYLEEGFAGFLKERPSVTWITEERPLGTAGAVAGARDLLDGTFLALNGDVLTDLDLTALVAFHRERRAIGTIALYPVEDARPFGLVETEPDGHVIAFREKPADLVPGTINAGTYVLEPDALDDVPAGAKVSIERETFPSLIERTGRLYALVAGGYWRDLGTPEAYLAAHADALDGMIGGPYERPLLGEGVRLGERARIDERTVLGEAVSVGAGARIEGSVVHRGASLGEGSVVERSIVGPGAEIGTGAVVRDAIMAEGARVRPGARLEGARVRPGETAG